MTLNGCSMTRFLSDGTTEEHVVLISLPASLMQKFCVLKPPGDTVGQLADAYVDNTTCGKKYETQVDEQIKYFDAVKDKSVPKNTTKETSKTIPKTEKEEKHGEIRVPKKL